MLEQPNLNHLKIWQQNARKSLTVQLATLHSVEDKYDIICIQEPYFDFQSLSRATGVWTSVYPTGFSRATEGPAPRALTLIHTIIVGSRYPSIHSMSWQFNSPTTRGL